MSKMKIKVHEAKDLRIGTLNINNALEWNVAKNDYCVVVTDEGNRNYKVALYAPDGSVLDEETTTLYHAACYFRGTKEALYKGGTDRLVFYRG